MTLLFEAAKILLLAFLGQTTVLADRGLATRFGDPGDPLDGEHLACTHEKMLPTDLACAHRTLPCGTVVTLLNPRTGLMAACKVLDRGPYGALLPSGDWVMKIRESDPGQWRGMIDLGPAVANMLQLNGREKIWAVYPKPEKRHFGRRVDPSHATLTAAAAGGEDLYEEEVD